MARIEVYAREIVPSFNAYVYFRIGYWLAKNCAKFLYRVRIGYVDRKGLAAVAPKSTVVFVMNHRSNMDYVLVAFLAAEQVALSYAVGEWARSLAAADADPLDGRLLRAAQFGRPAVSRRAAALRADGHRVRRAAGGVSGGRADGATASCARPSSGSSTTWSRPSTRHGERDLVFVPVGINYDRVLEDRTLLLKLDGGARRPGRLRAAMTSAASSRRTSA